MSYRAIGASRRGTGYLQSQTASHANCWLILSLIGLLASISYAQPGGPETQGPPPQMVRVGQIKRQTLQEHRPVIGRLREIRRSIVASEQAGRVTQIHVEPGNAVDGGETALASIDDIWAELELDAQRAALAQAKAGVAEAHANLNQANRDFAYLEELGQRGSAKPKEIEDARSQTQAAQARLDRAKADVMVAEAAIARADESLARLTVIAPFDGLVVAKLTEVGQWVNQGDPIAEIISRGRIDAVIDVPERLVNEITIGEQAELRLTGIDLTAQGKVVAINPSGASAARTFPVKIRLDDQEGKLKAGMSVTAMIPAGEARPTLTVPRDAVLRSPLGNVMWAAVNNQAMRVPVKILFESGDRYAIEIEPAYAGPPLDDASLVVVEGAERLLFPGQPLNVISQEPANKDEATSKTPNEKTRNSEVTTESGAGVSPAIAAKL